MIDVLRKILRSRFFLGAVCILLEFALLIIVFGWLYDVFFGRKTDGRA